MSKKALNISLLLGIILLAAVVRGVYLYQSSTYNPGFEAPSIDSLYHDRWAMEIASGDLWGQGAFFRAPLYPYFLAAVYAIFGHNYFVPRLIQHLLGLLVVLLIYLVGIKVFDRRTALLATFVAASYWVFIYFEGELLLDSLAMLLDLLLVYYLLHCNLESSKLRWLGAGAILGLSAITRPNVLVLIPAVWLWIYLLSRQEGEERRAVMPAVLLLLGALVLISPVTLRNLLVGDDLVLIASQGGINFYIGNNPHSDGATANLPEFGNTWEYADAKFLAERQSGELLKPSGVSQFYYHQGLSYILKEPADFLKLLLKKVYLLTNSFEISNNQDLYFVRRYASITTCLPLGFQVIGPFAILGLILLLLNRIKRTSGTNITIFFVLVYSASVVAFFVTARFRLPLLPFLIIFAARAFFWLWDVLKERRLKVLGYSLVVLFFLGIIVNTNWAGMRTANYSQAYFNLGNTYLRQGDYRKALQSYRKASEENPTQPLAHLNAGTVHFAQGRYDGAEQEFKKEIEIDPREPKTYNNLSVLSRLKGDYPSAVSYARMAVAFKENYEAGYYNLALAKREAGKAQEAAETLDSALEKFPDFTNLLFLLGQIHQEGDSLEAAKVAYSEVISLSPRGTFSGYDLSTIYSEDLPFSADLTKLQAKAHFNLGIIDLTEGDLQAAKEDFARSTELNPSFAEAWENLGLCYDLEGDYETALTLMQKAIECDPRNEVYYFNIALTWAKSGDLERARENLQRALRLNPDFAQAKDKINLVEKLLHSQEENRK
jgi:tetratricopeptide (TPR) repeat protein